MWRHLQTNGQLFNPLLMLRISVCSAPPPNLVGMLFWLCFFATPKIISGCQWLDVTSLWCGFLTFLLKTCRPDGRTSRRVSNNRVYWLRSCLHFSSEDSYWNVCANIQILRWMVWQNSGKWICKGNNQWQCFSTLPSSCYPSETVPKSSQRKK